MKTTNLKSLLFISLIAITFSSCINDDYYDNIDEGCTTATPTKTVQEIYDTATAEPVIYAEEDIIEAYVTSSDAGGTFYKSISLVSIDGTKGFSIPVDMYNIYTEFEPGRKVYVYLKNRYYNITYKSLIIGGLYTELVNDVEVYSVGRLVPEDFRKTMKASCEKIDEEDLVQPVTITEALDNNYINKLIEIDNVQFSDEALNTNYYNPNNDIGGATNINIVDEDGNKIIFRTSEFAKFAGHPVASGRGKIRGVLTKYNSDFQFLARTEADIQLTGPRLVPLFEETFSSNFPLWIKHSVVGSQIWTLDTTFGNPGSCAKMSGYSSGNKANEDWLISPVINMTTIASATLSFDTATKFAGAPLQVLISSDYSGSGDPTSATWTPFTAILSPSTGSYIWTGSGKINISEFSGSNIYISFKYTSTTDSGPPTPQKKQALTSTNIVR